MRGSTPVQYDNIKNCDKLDRKIGKCVIDNFLGVYMPHIKKLNEHKFISMCEEYYRINSIDDEDVWTIEQGVTPACLQSICMKYKISHYAYDIYNKCFFKNIGNRYFPVFMLNH